MGGGGGRGKSLESQEVFLKGSKVGIWEPHLFEAHELCVVKDEKDAEDEEPGNDVKHKAQEGHPGGPWLCSSCPQHRASGNRFPVSHHQLGKDEGLGDLDPEAAPTRNWLAAPPTFTVSITNKYLACGGCWVGSERGKDDLFLPRRVAEWMRVTREVHSSPCQAPTEKTDDD